jgi:hypothetical protein
MYNKILYYIILMPRKKSRRRKQRGGGGPDDYSTKPQQRTYVDTIHPKKKRIFAKVVPSNSKGGLKEPLLGESVSKKPKYSSKNLKNIYEKGKNILQGFNFKDMLLWAVWFVAIVIYSISITKSSGSDLILWTYGILLGCTLFIGFAHYLSKKNKDSDVMSASWGILKSMIPLLSSIFGLAFIFLNYSSNLKTISIIGKYVEELSIFNNIIAFSSFLQVSRLISYFKSMGSKQTQNLFDYVIFTICFIIQMTLTIIIFNKLESYATNC